MTFASHTRQAKKMSKFRKLKIHTKHQARRYYAVTIPEIRLEGKWLDELGFKQGQTVLIQLENKKLIITVEQGTNKSI